MLSEQKLSKLLVSVCVYLGVHVQPVVEFHPLGILKLRHFFIVLRSHGVHVFNCEIIDLFGGVTQSQAVVMGDRIEGKCKGAHTLKLIFKSQ
jgi:hypothetical protein